MDLEVIKTAAERVYEQLDFGLSEAAYQTALAEELREEYDDIQTEVHVSEYYTTSGGRKIQVASLRIDILIENRIILELKSITGKLEKKDIETTSKQKEYKQCKRYQKLKDIKQGYLINFGEKGLDFISISI